jgi:hypothetical protein
MSTVESARTFYKQVLSPDNVINNWEFVLEHIIRPEVAMSIGARLMNRGQARYALQMVKEQRKIVSSVLAAEFFPDSNPPKMVVAESELETHDDLRERYKEAHPDTEPRISGDIVTEKGGRKFFKMDRVMVSVGATTLFGMRSKLGDAVEILLGMGLVPIDAECNIVPPNL